MPLPEGYLPRKGDTLKILVTVEHDVEADDTYIFTRFSDSDRVNLDLERALAQDADVWVENRQWRKGDRVLDLESGSPGEVIIVESGAAVVRLDDGRGLVVRYSYDDLSAEHPVAAMIDREDPTSIPGPSTSTRPPEEEIKF